MVLDIRTRFCIRDLDQEGLEGPVLGRPGQMKAVPGHITDGEMGHNWLLLLWVMIGHQRRVTEVIENQYKEHIPFSPWAVDWLIFDSQGPGLEILKLTLFKSNLTP